MPHQGIVALSISAFSIVVTLSLLFLALRDEKRSQAQNTDGH